MLFFNEEPHIWWKVLQDFLSDNFDLGYAERFFDALHPTNNTSKYLSLVTMDNSNEITEFPEFTLGLDTIREQSPEWMMGFYIDFGW